MQIAHLHRVIRRLCAILPLALISGLLVNWVTGGPKQKAPKSADARLAPYAADEEDLWNRLHRALFVRTARDGGPRTHATDPLLYRGGTFLLEGEPHRRAVGLLDEFLAAPGRSIDEPLKRLFFQHDLWAAFDYVAWYPDDWVHHSRHEPAAIALRTRLAKAIGRLALEGGEIDKLPDNYALAVKSKAFPSDHDPAHPARPFLPADLFDAAGPWVRFHEQTALPMAERHFAGAGGRAAHVIFIRLPAGRTATMQYLKELGRDSIKQFPTGTMVAMVRRALTVDRSAKVRVTPVTELVQVRVYRRIPANPHAPREEGDFGEQDVCEFVLDRAALFAGKHGLRAVGPEEPIESFDRSEGDPFVRPDAPPASTSRETQLKSCIQCHQAPGIYSVLSMRRGLRQAQREIFPTYAWDVELSYTVHAKVTQFNWGLLQGLLEAQR
jgi:hypothetical protein